MTSHKGIFISLLWACTLVWTAIGQATPFEDQVAASLQLRLQTDYAPMQIHVAGVRLHSPTELIQFYSGRDHRPAWLGANAPLPQANALLAVVANAADEGLRSSDYHSAQLNTSLNQAYVGGQPQLQHAMDLDLLLTDAFITYGSHLLAGRHSARKAVNYSPVEPLRSRDLALILQQALQNGNITESLNSLAPAHPHYARLRSALSYYRSLARVGGWPRVHPGTKLKKGMRKTQVAQLRAHLRMSGDLSHQEGQLLQVANTNANQPSAGEKLFDTELQQAVKRFQKRHGLKEDGVVGPNTLKALNVPVEERIRQIELNMERLRWLPENLGQRHILVNIPNFTMSVMEDGKPVLDARAIVGKAKRPTPVFTGSMSYLVLSPKWNVPRSIAIKDKLPKLRKNPYALASQNIHIYNSAGKKIDPGSVNWHAVNKRNFSYRMRQDPGPRNALGGIKFMFPNRHSVYLHDTPSRKLFSRTERTYSSGCVRINKPVELAEYLLKDNPNWNRNKIIAASKGRRERSVRLSEEVPVHLLYWTAWAEEDGTLHFRKDIYSQDKSLSRVLHST